MKWEQTENNEVWAELTKSTLLLYKAENYKSGADIFIFS
jgi:hypothetical protein